MAPEPDGLGALGSSRDLIPRLAVMAARQPGRLAPLPASPAACCPRGSSGYPPRTRLGNFEMSSITLGELIVGSIEIRSQSHVIDARYPNGMFDVIQQAAWRQSY
jgi:hypothetical protein